MKKRLLAFLLVLVMVAGFVPVTARAEGETPAVVAQGTCGATAADNVTWVLTDDGVLTISGTGAMKNYQLLKTQRPPYESYKDQITSVVVVAGVTTIGNYGFYQYGNLSHVTIPETVTRIGGGCFRNTGLLEIIIPESITTWGTNVFTDCAELKTAIVNCELANGIFWNCSALESVTLADSVKSIPNNCFLDCTSLTSIDLSHIESIGTSAFSGCTSLASVNLPSAATVGMKAFFGCTGLQSAVVVGVSQQMFEGCTGLTEATILEGPATLPDMLFKNCTSLQIVTLPATVTSYGMNVFDGVDPLPEFRGAGAEQAAAYYYTQTDENGVYYTTDFSTLVKVPATFEGELIVRDGVSTIREEAAKGCVGITAVQLPNTLKTIGESAFSQCTALTAIVIPDGVETIGSSAFSGCSALAQVTLPAQLTVVQGSTFSDCTSLTSLIIPEGVTTLYSPFSGCTALAEVTLPSTLTTLGSFNGCSALKNIVIPEGITSIPARCFYLCNSLEWISLPYSLTSFGSNWIGSTSIQTFYYAGSYAEFDEITWDNPANKSILDSITLVCYYGNTPGNPEDAPVITVQPENKTFAQNADATNALAVTISGKGTGDSVYFDWFYKSSPEASGATRITASTVSEDGLTSYVTPSTEEKGVLYYYCVITKFAEDRTMTQTTSELVHVSVTFSEFEGIGTYSDPYQLKNLEDLETLRQLIAQGEQFKGVWFKLMNDINLPADWEPLGYSSVNTRAFFVGNLEGGGHTITIANGGSGLFGYVRESTVQNLNFYAENAVTPLLVTEGYIDYGDDNNSGTGIPRTLDAYNCNILSGSTINAVGGLISGTGSSGNIVNITGCTINENVTINGGNGIAGSFAGAFVGTITNCVSYANVYGKNYVGGIIAKRANAVGPCRVVNSSFYGTVTASGDNVGGIVGGSYIDATAPNVVPVSVEGCTFTGTVNGVNNVGGIIGNEGGLQQSYNAQSAGNIRNNTVTGTVTATGSNVGAIAGLYSHLDRYTIFENNTYTACNISNPFGRVYHVDTSAVELGWHDVPGMADQVFYFDSSRTDYTAEQKEDIYTALWTGWEDSDRWKPTSIIPNVNRYDDPLSANDPGQVTVTSLTLSGEYKTEYLVGDELDTTNMTITATYSDNTEETVDPSEVTFNGFDTTTPGVKEITVTFGGAYATFNITVTLPAETVKVKLSVLGDTHHDVVEDSDVHGLWIGGLETWLAETEYEVTNTAEAPATAWKLFQQAVEADPTMTMFARDTERGKYIYAMQKGDVTLTEKDNAVDDNKYYSGWMYAVNDEHVQVAVDKYFLQEGDVIILHWVDDSQLDEAYHAQHDPTQQDKQAAMAVEALIDAIGTPVTLESEAAITAARTAYDALNDNAKSYVDPDCYAILTAAEAALAELKASAQRVADVIAAINALPAADELTLNDETAVAAARAAYDALSEAEQAQVTNLAALEAAEAKIDQLEAEQDQQAASAADAVIAALPAVDAITLDDAAAVAEARAAYDALTPEQQALVNNYDALLAAEAKIAELQEQAASAQRVAEATAAIDALPAADEVTLADEAAVIAARMAYDALSDAEKAQVSADKLIAAEAKIAELKAQQSSEEKITDATEKINAIPAADAVTLADEAAIAAARAAYDALTDAEKAQVDASALVAAEARLAALKFAALKPEVKTANAKNGKIELTITPVAGAVKYKIFVSEKADGTYKEAATVTEPKYTYNGTPGQQYFFKVVAVNAAGVESAESAVVSQFRLPAQVTSLKVKSKKKKEVTLTWKKVTGAKKYVIYMSKNGKTGWKKIGTVKTNKFTYKKAPAGKKMYFRVQAVTANGKKGEFSKAVSVKVKK